MSLLARRSRRLVRLVVVPALLAAAAIAIGSAMIAPASAGADTLTVDFESGPALDTPVNDDYLASAFVRWIAADPGFRPYRRSAPSQARSGTVAVDVGASVCFPETPGAGSDCEFPASGTVARLTRTASSVTLHAGLFTDAGAPVNVQLLAYRADDRLIATGPLTPVTAAGFRTPVTVTSAAGDIARFALVTVGATGDSLGFDDLVLDYPAGSLPDVSAAITSAVVPVLQGKTTDVPLSLTRLNGSDGPLDLSVTGLPAGVTGELVPDPVSGVQDTATLRLTSTPDAATFDVPQQATIAIDPGGNANVAPAPRSVPLLIRVGGNFDLRTAGATAAALPECAPVDVPLIVARDRSFTGTVTLGVENVPAGVTAQVLPSATIPPGGGFNAEAAIRFSRIPGAALPATVLVRASSPGAPDRTLRVALSAAPGSAVLASGVGGTPRHFGQGTRIRVDGPGFCPGTRVMVGNDRAVTGAEVAPDLRSLTFNVPRLATTGTVTILPPAGGAAYAAASTLRVDSVRNRAGFQFSNPSYGSLSISELTEAFGADDLFIKVNPCWPWGSCTIVTGILNPISAIDWGVLNIALHSSGGHCFGISRAADRLRGGRVSLRRFDGAATSAFELPAASGPGGSLMSYLDAEHATQGSAEFISAFLHRSDAIASQLQRLDRELTAGREPIVTIASGSFGEGHAMLAYDRLATATGYDVLVYDSNRPFLPGELSNSTAHADREAVGSAIHVNAAMSTWTFDLGSVTWTGGNDGSFFIAPQSTVPEDPSLPGIGTLGDFVSSLFGSDGSVRSVGGSDRARRLPALDSHAPAGASGWWAAPGGSTPLEVRVVGVRRGRFSQAFTAPGFAAAVTDVSTAPGVRDSLRGSGARDEVRFAGGRDRPLTLRLASGAAVASGSGAARAARASGAVAGAGAPAARASAGASGAGAPAARASADAGAPPAWGATLRTRTFAGGDETAGLAGNGTLRYAHDGAATSLSFTLTSVRANGGPARFESGPVRVGSGDSLTVRPAGGDLSRVRVVTRTRAGRTTTRVLRNRARGPARLSWSSPLVAADGRSARAKLRVSKLSGQAVAGVSLRLTRGGRTVLRRASGVARARNGARAFRWRIPARLHGRYRLVLDARLATGGVAPASATASRARSVAIR